MCASRRIFGSLWNAAHEHRQQDGSRRPATNLLETLNDRMLAIQDKHSVVVAYIDFSKAFDTVCHNKLSD